MVAIPQKDLCEDLSLGNGDMKSANTLWKGTLLTTVLVALIMCSQPPRVDLTEESNRAVQGQIFRYQSSLDSTVAYVEMNASRFAVDKLDQFQMLGPEAHEDLVGVWVRYLDIMTHLDLIRYTNQTFYNHLSIGINYHEFANYYLSFLIQSTRALHFIGILDRNSALSTILDEAHPEHGLQENSFTNFKTHFLNPNQALEYAALKVIYRDQRPEINPYYSNIAMLEGLNTSLGLDYGVRLSLKHAQEVVGDQSYAWWFPVQKEIANWAGHTRLFRENENLLTADDVSDIRTQLLPGDILFQRREWYMTNAGIPGYWTHAALYVGTPEQRSSYFSDDSVAHWLSTMGIPSGDLDSLLLRDHPGAYGSHLFEDDSLEVADVIEAISPGVVFQTLAQSLSCDGVGVLRPRLTKAEKAEAIYTSFKYWGRGYDYNFDFLTDSTLVCSELVYKTFLPRDGQTGIEFRTEKVAGRLMTPANRMVRQFDQEYGNMNLDFVLFYDGDELRGESEPSDEKTFRKSWRRLDFYPLLPSESLLLSKNWKD